MAMRLVALISLARVLMASPGKARDGLACGQAAWILSFKTSSGKDLCLDGYDNGLIQMNPCSGASEYQQWYSQGNMIRNLLYGTCLTRVIQPTSTFALRTCDDHNLLQHFTATSENGELFLKQGSFCLTLGWNGNPLAQNCSMNSDKQKNMQALTKTAVKCLQADVLDETVGTLDQPLQREAHEDHGAIASWQIMFSKASDMMPSIAPAASGMLMALFLTSLTARIHRLLTKSTKKIETLESLLAELLEEMKERGMDQSKLEMKIDQGLVDLADLKGKVEQMECLPSLITNMDTEINSVACEMDSCSASMSAFIYSFGWWIQSTAEQLTELTKEMKESREDQSKLELKIDQGLEDHTIAEHSRLESKVHQGLLDQMAVLQSQASNLDSLNARIPADTSALGPTLKTLLTDLTTEMKSCRIGKFELNIDHGFAEQMAALKRQVDQLERLMSSMGREINFMSRVDNHETSDTSSSAGSLDSWIHIPGGEPCCYLPDTYFQVRTADGDEILSPATRLIEGSEVRADDGTWVQVASPPEQHHRPVIKLQADQSFLVVSEDHRIVVRGNQTAPGQSLATLFIGL